MIKAPIAFGVSYSPPQRLPISLKGRKWSSTCVFRTGQEDSLIMYRSCLQLFSLDFHNELNQYTAQSSFLLEKIKGVENNTLDKSSQILFRVKDDIETNLSLSVTCKFCNGRQGFARPR